MIVKNWMKPTPVTVTGDMLLAEASRIFTESSLHGLPVVEDGRLRGLITRANCLRAAHHVAKSGFRVESEHDTTGTQIAAHHELHTS